MRQIALQRYFFHCNYFFLSIFCCIFEPRKLIRRMLEYQKSVENYDEPNYTKAIKAGRRTYFFDVKATRGEDLYITITESRKRNTHNGDIAYDRRTMFLYKEDFAKFINGLNDAIDYIKQNKPELFDEEGNLIQQDTMSSIDEEFEKL